ncbi:MAG: LysO family transporter, partial [Vibrio sp.]
MLSGMMFIFAPLLVGYLITLDNPLHLHRLSRATAHLVYVILFLMGLSLAGLDNLQANLQTIVNYSAVFFVLLGACNLLALPLIDRYLPLHTDSKHNKPRLSSMILESAKLILVVGAGLIVGIVLNQNLNWVGSASSWILFLLLFFIGIQLRNSGLSLKQILLNKHGMIIAAVIVATSWLGGVLAAWLLDMP